jgi:hypothetical protein
VENLGSLLAVTVDGTRTYRCHWALNGTTLYSAIRSIITVIIVHEYDTSQQNETDGEFDTHGKNKIGIESWRGKQNHLEAPGTIVKATC